MSNGGWKKYNIIQSNCKTLARSILYFCKKGDNYGKILESMVGIYTDKPFKIGYNISFILL